MQYIVSSRQKFLAFNNPNSKVQYSCEAISHYSEFKIDLVLCTKTGIAVAWIMQAI